MTAWHDDGYCSACGCYRKPRREFRNLPYCEEHYKQRKKAANLAVKWGRK